MVEELLDAAVRHIRESGIEGLSLRDLAREVGVSHGAPYRHFADKKALLIGIATQGYQLLFTGLERAFAESKGGPIDQLSNMAFAYVQFAIKNPVHLSLMYGPELTSSADHEEEGFQKGLEDASSQVLQMVQGVISHGQRAGALAAGDVLIQTAATWSMVHGLAILKGTGCLDDGGFEKYDEESLIRSTVRMIFDGLRAR